MLTLRYNQSELYYFVCDMVVMLMMIITERVGLSTDKNYV